MAARVSNDFKTKLDLFVDWRNTFGPSITTVTLAVTERYCRRKLKLKKGGPLQYAGLDLTCIGSKAWRNNQQTHL